MIKFLIKVAVILIIGILIYNYFFGTSSEKETSKKVFLEVKELAISVKDLVKSEKEKFDAGKYDTAMEKINGAINSIGKQVKKGHSQYNELKEIQQRRALVSQELENLRADPDVKKNDPRIKALNRDLQELTDQLERVTEKLNEKK